VGTGNAIVFASVCAGSVALVATGSPLMADVSHEGLFVGLALLYLVLRLIGGGSGDDG